MNKRRDQGISFLPLSFEAVMKVSHDFLEDEFADTVSYLASSKCIEEDVWKAVSIQYRTVIDSLWAEFQGKVNPCDSLVQFWFRRKCWRCFPDL